MKTGRNEPCPCGSGKKYKKCCLGKTEATSREFYYRRLSEAFDQLVKRLLGFAEKTFGKETALAAMEEFLPWPKAGGEISEEMLDRSGLLFWPWYFFNWECELLRVGGENAEPGSCTVAELYAEKHKVRLDTLEKRLIESINRKPYSFFEVLTVDRGKGMKLQDILTGARIWIQEITGSQYVEPDDILFGRAVDVDGVGMLIGLAPTIIPPGRKADIIQLRKQMQRSDSTVTEDTLYEWDTEIRELYFNIDRALYTMPKMCNTDGHALEFHKLIYDISSIDEAFEKLRDLCVTMTPEELYADAERDEAGRIVRVEIPWDRLGHKNVSGMPNTILGRIVIDGRRLTAEVNSAERAQSLRREIEARLGDGVRFKVDEIQDLDAMMNRDATGSAVMSGSSDHEELLKHPEVQAQMAEIFGRQWESWVDERIPALGGKSPRNAVKTADGREAVDALLKDFERDRGQDPVMAEMNRKGIKRVRDILGFRDR